MLRAALWWDFARVEPGRVQCDRDVCTPARGTFNANQFNAPSVEELDRFAISRCRVRERFVVECDAVMVNESDRERVLVRVDARNDVKMFRFRGVAWCGCCESRGSAVVVRFVFATDLPDRIVTQV